MEKNKKYSKYHDYVIRDGKLVGEYEEMYQDHDNPWNQVEAANGLEKKIGIDCLKSVGAKRVIDLGCGLGDATQFYYSHGFDILGVDISSTAISKAKIKALSNLTENNKNSDNQFHKIQFEVGSVLSFDLFRKYNPDAFIMSDITWYILDCLDEFSGFLKNEMQGKYLLHSITFYPPGVQKYGLEKFHDMKTLLKYFDLDYQVTTEISMEEQKDSYKSIFLAKIPYTNKN